MEREGSTVSGKSLRERHKEATRRELRAAALRLFGSKGFGRTSVDDIAHEAGVSRSTFFRYFPTKESIVSGEVEKNAELFVDMLRKRPHDEDRMRALEETFVAFAAEVGSDNRREESLAMERVVSSERALLATRDAVIARWRHRVAHVLAERDGREEPNLEDALASAIVSQMTEQMSIEWRTTNTTATELIRNYFETLRRLIG